MKKALKTIYVSAIPIWFILACVFQVATSKAGMALLIVIMLLGLYAWIMKNYLEGKETDGT